MRLIDIKQVMSGVTTQDRNGHDASRRVIVWERFSTGFSTYHYDGIECVENRNREERDEVERTTAVDHIA